MKDAYNAEVYRYIVTLLITRLLSISTYCGVTYRKETIIKHISSAYHKQFIISYQQKIEGIKQSGKTQQSNYISKGKY